MVLTGVVFQPLRGGWSVTAWASVTRDNDMPGVKEPSLPTNYRDEGEESRIILALWDMWVQTPGHQAASQLIFYHLHFLPFPHLLLTSYGPRAGVTITEVTGISNNGGMSAVGALLLAIPTSIKRENKKLMRRMRVFCFWHEWMITPRAPSRGIHLNHWLLNQEKEKCDKPKNIWQVLTGVQVCNANANALKCSWWLLSDMQSIN